ncbi:MAG TPA: hypothetical protein VGJ84_04430 [Polyangiaceae bacterium]
MAEPAAPLVQGHAAALPIRVAIHKPVARKTLAARSAAVRQAVAVKGVRAVLWIRTW